MCPLDKRRWAPPRNRAQRFSAEFAFAAARAYRCEPTSTTMKSSFLFLSLVFAVTSPSLPAAATKTVDDFRTAAAKANAALTFPGWAQTPKAAEAMMTYAILTANKARDQTGWH